MRFTAMCPQRRARSSFTSLSSMEAGQPLGRGNFPVFLKVNFATSLSSALRGGNFFRSTVPRTKNSYYEWLIILRHTEQLIISGRS